MSVDPRLEARDRRPLPPDTVVRVQAIARGQNPAWNYLLELDEGGTVRFVHHSGDPRDQTVPLDRPMPADATADVGPVVASEVEQALRDGGFSQLPAHAEAVGMQDGGWLVVRARVDDGEREVIFEGMGHPLAHRLALLAHQFGLFSSGDG